ncbi:MAG: anaerobic ribonucleoside-triphosphate reductase activating protein [Candidatus Helarchaeota archaeon]
MKISIGGYKDVSTIDYPGEVVSVVFFCGCPFRCPFCQNVGLVTGEDCKEISIEEIHVVLEKYSSFITGTCITGGEPCVQEAGLSALLSRIKQFGKRKIDTNGFYPNVVNEILKQKLVEYIAIDIKAPLNPQAYGKVVGLIQKGDKVVDRVKQTLIHINAFRPDVYLEIRTTIVPNLIYTRDEIESIARNVEADCFTLQQFRSNMGTLDPLYRDVLSPPRSLLMDLGEVIKNYHSCVKIRTIEKGEEKL